MTSPFRRLATPPANRTLRTRLQTTLLEDRTVPATFTVTDLGDTGAGTLRDAVTQANANPDADTIVFATTGTITLASEIDITESVTITGAGAVTLDGGGTNRIFEINNAASLLNVTLSGLTLQNGLSAGDGGAVAVTDDENVTVRDSLFTGNSAVNGGALYFTGGILQIFNTTFSLNNASSGGGAVYVEDGVIQIEDSEFTGNTAVNDGGGLYAANLYGGVITGTTFTGNSGQEGGGVLLYEVSGSILIDDCDISGNISTGNGGGLYAGSFYYGSTLTIANTTITNNTTTGDGGGIGTDSFAGTLRIISTTITGNTAADDGGGVFFNNESEAAVIDITDSTISGNTATAGFGGGLALYMYSGAATITDTVISGNTAGDNGGGIAIYYNNTDLDAKITIVGSTISGNTAANNGGGIWWYTTNSDNSGDLIITDSDISGNVATTGNGGGVWMYDNGFYGTVRIQDTTITGNTADGNAGGFGFYGSGVYSPIQFIRATISGNTATTGDGGGLFLHEDDGFYSGVFIFESTISGNTAGDEGGGIFFYDNDGDAALTIESSTISGNTAATDGGGIWFYSSDGPLVLKNSTVSGNTATTGDGGGVFIDDNTETVQFLNSTIVLNVAGGNGGGIFTDGTDVSILSTIVSGNTASAGNDIDGSSGSFYVAFSLIEDTTIAGAATLEDLGFNLFGVDPLLGALQDNGGPTFTHALLRGSPAINFGFNFAGTLYDQRGQPFLRTFGSATDIGAYEFQPPPPEPIVVGAGAGGSGEFVVYNLDGTERARITAFDPSVTGGVRVATADVTGDGVYDYIVGAGPGAPSLVKIYDGTTLNQIAILIAFEATFTGGVYVAGGDVDGDGFAEVVVTPDQGGGPVVAVYDGESLAGGSVVQLARFLGIQDENFRGGARVAVGDVTGDGLADIVVAAGFEGGPRVTVWDGTQVLAGNTGLDATPFANFFAFEDTLRNGTFVAVGDLDGDGFGDVIVGAGPGGGPRVVVFDGADLATGTLTETASFFAGDESLRNGVPVAVADLNGDAELDVVAGVGEPAAGTTGSPATVRVYSASSLTDDPLNPIATLDPFPGFTGGVFVG